LWPCLHQDHHHRRRRQHSLRVETEGRRDLSAAGKTSMKRFRRFAYDTKVPVAQTRSEIEDTLTRYGATAFAYAVEPKRAAIMFECNSRRIRFVLPLPEGIDSKASKEARRMWRALLLALKARLESVQSGIETFEEAFLAHVVMPDGKTVAEHTIPSIAA